MITAVWLAALALAGEQAPPASPPAQAPAKPPATSDAAVAGVTVNGQRAAVETTIDRRSYSVANDLQAKTGSVADVLRNVPAVQVDVQGNVSLRGNGDVTVLVDGRPSAQFSKDNLAQALQSVPADQIERIEVITNPSAEFQADGTAGIINLIMKKAKGVGKTGSLRVASTSTGAYSATVNNGFNSDKLSGTDNLSYRHDHLRLTADNETSQPDPVSGFLTSRDRVRAVAKVDLVQGHAGLDYDLTPKTRLSGSLTGIWQDVYQPFSDQFQLTSGAGSTLAAFNRVSPQVINARNGQVDATLRHKFGDAHDVTFNVAYSDNEVHNNRIDITTPATPAGADPAQSVNRNNFNRRAAFTTDYQKPLTGGVQLKAGYLFEYIDNFIEHSGGSGPSATVLTPDASKTDNFADDETHNQAYVTLQKKVGKLTVLGGIRAETVHLALDQRTLNIQSDQDYNRIYPTLHLAYPLSDGRNLTASYSKRVQRPIPADLDPFRSTVSSTAAVQGNPDLTPQDTDSYELGYENRKGAAFKLLTLYYRQTNNAFSVVTSDLGNGVLLQMRENVGQQRNGGFEFVMGNKLSPKLTYNFSVDGYWTDIRAANLGFTNDNSAYTGFGRANLTWQVTPKDLVQFNVFANGKQLLPQGYAAPTFSGNIGYRHDINNKFSWMFVVQDPFKTLKNKLVLDTGTVTSRRTQEQNSRMVSLALVWNFAGKPRDTGFDFVPGGGGAAAVP